jgi:hypothetical protein
MIIAIAATVLFDCGAFYCGKLQRKTQKGIRA